MVNNRNQWAKMEFSVIQICRKKEDYFKIKKLKMTLKMHKIINFSVAKILLIKDSLVVTKVLARTTGCLETLHLAQINLIKTCLGFPPIFQEHSMNHQREGYSKCNQISKYKMLL